MAMCLWLTGRAGSGKSTIGRAVADELERAGLAVALLDEDEISRLADGLEPIEWLVGTLTKGGVTTVVAADRPDRDDRERIRATVAEFVEVFVDGGTGTQTDDSYEEPFAPELRVPTHDRDPSASIALVTSWLEHTGFLEV
jgi:adenylylsulfate kinase